MKDLLAEAQKKADAAWVAGTTAHVWLNKASETAAREQDQEAFSRLFSLAQRAIQLAHLWAGLKRDIERERGL